MHADPAKQGRYSLPMGCNLISIGIKGVKNRQLRTSDIHMSKDAAQGGCQWQEDDASLPS
eukprot:664502-Pelagomonas_calceolata.AAC.11